MKSNVVQGTVAPAANHSLFRLLRPHQWVKNAFVLAPLVFTGRFLEVGSVVQSVEAMLLFCMASSAAYIINDIHDLEDDRRHAGRRATRPLAAGQVTLTLTLALLGVVLAVLAVGCAGRPEVGVVIAVYLVLNLGYTFFIRDLPYLDILAIATGFVLRVQAGAVVLAVPVSPWMFVATLSLAIFLAAMKRRWEMDSGGDGRRVLRHYSIFSLNICAGLAATAAIVCYAAFTLIVQPPLALSLPLVIAGFARYGHLVTTRGLGESPAEAVFSDRWMLLVVALWSAMCIGILSPAAG